MTRYTLLLSLLLASPLLASGPKAAAPARPKLPLVEVAVPAGTSSDTLVVFVSGDGGWAKIDKEISAVLAATGMPVVGLNALQYFWTKKTPETASADLQFLMESYLATWNKSRVLLVGYSRGADVLPAMVSRLPQELRAKIRLLALLGPSTTVEFEFHVTDWMHDSKSGFPVKPEIDKLRDMRLLCLYGEDDKATVCPALVNTPAIDVVMLKGSHHFDGGYGNLGRIILDHLK
jgi:type IV secretory pathway VirJ component